MQGRVDCRRQDGRVVVPTIFLRPIPPVSPLPAGRGDKSSTEIPAGEQVNRDSRRGDKSTEIPAGEQVNRDPRRGTSQQRFPQGNKSTEIPAGGKVDRDFCRKDKSIETFAGRASR